MFIFIHSQKTTTLFHIHKEQKRLINLLLKNKFESESSLQHILFEKEEGGIDLDNHHCLDSFSVNLTKLNKGGSDDMSIV